MTEKNLPSPELLRKLLRYEPSSGKLFWRKRPNEMFKTSGDCKRWNATYAGNEAGSLKRDGYISIKVISCVTSSHRIVWAMQTGGWPKGEIDHINGKKTDNRMSNLRDVKHSENMKNQKTPKNNKSGVAGVFWDKSAKKWKATIYHKNKSIYLGRFEQKDDAIAARLCAQGNYGYHENHCK
jgi:hypothetical protein